MRFEGTAIRLHDPKRASQPLSGQGAAIAGGRFNPRGTPALYLGLNLETALKEVGFIGFEKSGRSSDSAAISTVGVPFGRECQTSITHGFHKNQTLRADSAHVEA